jgi:ribosomal-protein-alanine N-acetyltransferase
MTEKQTQSQLNYRLAKPREAEQLARLSRRLIEYGLPWWCWTPNRMRRSIRCADTVALIAERDDKTVGFALMQFGEERAHLNLLAVEPTHRNQGIGTGLVAWLEESCSVAGVLYVLLEVRARNGSARRFYRGLGYEELEFVENYYCGREAAVRMIHDLRRTHDA